MNHVPDKPKKQELTPSQVQVQALNRIWKNAKAWKKEVLAKRAPVSEDTQNAITLGPRHSPRPSMPLRESQEAAPTPRIVHKTSFDIGRLPDVVLKAKMVQQAISEHRTSHRITASFKRDSNQKSPTVPTLLNAILTSPESIFRPFTNLSRDPDGPLRFSVARQMAGLSQGHVSKALEKNPSIVVRHESGKEPLSVKALERCEELFHCTPATLESDISGYWLCIGSPVRWWDVEGVIPAEWDVQMANRHPSWARQWIQPFAKFMAQHRDQITERAQGFQCLPMVNAEGVVVMKSFVIDTKG